MIKAEPPVFGQIHRRVKLSVVILLLKMSLWVRGAVVLGVTWFYNFRKFIEGITLMVRGLIQASLFSGGLKF